MCTIENKRIVLADFRLQLKKEWIGNALCSYEYNTAREGFKNILKIDLDIVYPLNKANSSTHKCFEVEVKFIEDFSQAFNLVKDYLNAECWGTEIITVKTIFEFNYMSSKDNIIRLTLKEPNMVPYEIENLTNKKYLSLSDMNEDESIKYGYENLL